MPASECTWYFVSFVFGFIAAWFGRILCDEVIDPHPELVIDPDWDTQVSDGEHRWWVDAGETLDESIKRQSWFLSSPSDLEGGGEDVACRHRCG